MDGFGKQIYEITHPFPTGERFGLGSQMRRAAVFIPSNIPESYTQNSSGEFVQFISCAEGSAAALETQLLVGTEPDFRAPEAVRPAPALIKEIQKMSASPRRYLTHRL